MVAAEGGGGSGRIRDTNMFSFSKRGVKCVQVVGESECFELEVAGS